MYVCMYVYMFVCMYVVCTCVYVVARVDKEEGRVSNCPMLLVICAGISHSHFD